MKILAWDGGTRYLASAVDPLEPTSPAQIVDAAYGTVSEPLQWGSIVVQGEPDDWLFDEAGPDAASALELVTGSTEAH